MISICNQANLEIISGKVAKAARESLGDKLDKVILYGSYARGDYNETTENNDFIVTDEKDRELTDKSRI